MAEGGLDGIHLEGLYIESDLNILTSIGTNATVDGLTIVKCRANGLFFYQKSTNVVIRNTTFPGDMRCYPNAYLATNWQIENCVLEDVFGFATGSTFTFNHCIIRPNNATAFGATYLNSIITSNNIATDATATNCVFIPATVSCTTTNCWTGVANADLYVDANENGTYGIGKDYAVQNTYIGTDNTMVGPAGGNGWTLTPTVPTVPAEIPTTLTQDADDYYLIGSESDWNAFARLTRLHPSVNACMTADITLSEGNQTMIGTFGNMYQGIFDGQGHTLTINYDMAQMRASAANPIGITVYGVAPFYVVQNTTIKNLHVDGNFTVKGDGAAGIVGWVYGTTNLVERCHSSVNFTEDGTMKAIGGVVYLNREGTLNLNDCLYDGIMTAPNGEGLNGGLVCCRWNGTANVNNGLLLGTINTKTYDGCTLVRGGANINNSYYLNGFATLQGVPITEEKLRSGEVTFKLQNNRPDLFWGQTIGVDTVPILTTDESKRVYYGRNGYSNTPYVCELEQDGEGYYSIGSIEDWRDFSVLILTTPTANARLTTDINLGDDQTKIGLAYDQTVRYKGIFDGQGHTLTYNYTGAPDEFSSPFPHIEGATIKNLHIDGTMTSQIGHGGGIVANSWGSSNIINKVWVSSVITSTMTGTDECAAFVGCQRNGNLNISDCVFTGTINASTNNNGCFIGYIDSGSATTSNCLAMGIFNYTGNNNAVTRGTLTNCFSTQQFGTITGATITTILGLTNGNVTTALQNGRQEKVWVQDANSHTPMLNLFGTEDSGGSSGRKGDMNDDGELTVADVTILVNNVVSNE